MMTRGLVRAAVGLLVVLLGVAHADAQKPRRRPAAPKAAAPAATRPAAPPATDRAVPFRPGETLTYDIAWSSHLAAGVATLTVKDRRPSGGSSAYYIVAEGRPTGILSKLYTLYYKADTLLDSRVLLPQRGSIYSQEGSRQRTRITVFDHAAQRADYEVKTTTDVRASVALGRYSQDALSALYALRAVPLKEHSRLTMPVCDGGKMFRVQFVIGRTEPVRVGTASIPAFRVTPTIADAKGVIVGRAMTLWISADDRRLPLKLQAELAVGSINLTLRDAIR